MSNNELRKIPVKNYIILGVVMVVTFFLLYYFYMWIDVYKESKINIPIMNKYMTVINYNELDTYVVENPNTIIYVSVLEDELIRDFEKKLKSKYKNDEIDNEVLYMDITSDIMDENIKNEMVDNYRLNNLDITNVPCLLVFNEGVLKSIYSVTENEYDINKFVVYLNNVVVDGDDL